MKNLVEYFYKNPLRSLLVLGFTLRLLAAIFSGGYAMHDDHFLIIETASSWADDEDYNHWLPSTQKELGLEVKPEGHSLTYPGIHYLFFETFNSLGIDDPLFQMFLVRLIHAIFSLWLIYLAFKITDKISSRKNAIIVGLILAVGFVLPYLSVRNLVEVTCIPFFLYGIWSIIKANDFSGKVSKDTIKDAWKPFLIAGIFFGFAFAIRFQLFVFFGVLGLIFALQFKWRACVSLLLGFVVSLCLTQGIVDYFIWGKPFAEFLEYVNYNSNLDTAKTYASSTHWFTYPLILASITLPLAGIFYWFGTFRVALKYAWLFYPMIAFLLFHAFYPNYQERFIFPMLPIFLILGVIGWSYILEEFTFLKNRPKIWRTIFIISWVINFLALPLFTTFYGKQSRIMAAYHLYEKRNEQIYYIQEDVENGKATMFPRHYAGNWKISTRADINNLEQLKAWEAKEYKDANYVFLYGENDLENRISFFKKYFPKLSVEETIDPSFMDKVLHWLNPRNKNQIITVLNTHTNTLSNAK